MKWDVGHTKCFGILFYDILWWLGVHLIYSQNPGTSFLLLLCEWKLLCWWCNMGWPMKSSIILMYLFYALLLTIPVHFLLSKLYQFSPSVINNSNVIAPELILVRHGIHLSIMSPWWWTLTSFFTSQKFMKSFSMVGWLHKLYLNQVEISSDISKIHWLLISQKMCLHIIILTYYQFYAFFVSSTKWFYYSCTKNSWLGFLFTWTNRKKNHTTNKADGVTLIFQ